MKNTNNTIEISPDKIKAAKEWEIKNNIAIMYPTDDVDLQYSKFMDQHKDLRRKADWQAIDLFGVDNTTLYSMLKAKDVIKFNDKEEDVHKLSKQLIDIDSYTPDSIQESAQIENTKRKIKERINELSKDDYVWEFFYAPYFHPQEICELEGFYSSEVEDKAKSIYEEYNKYCNGLNNEFNIIEWDSEVRKLSYKLEYALYNNDYENINKYKQSLVQIGWNPEISYNDQNKSKAKARLESLLNKNYKNFTLINNTSLFEAFTGSEVIQESQNQKLYPISIVLVRGNSPVSNLIANTTHGDYSHSAICLDSDFNRLYSFNMNNHMGVGGFSLESIRNYPQENKLSVFSFFVNEDIYAKINKNIQELLNDINNSRYSFINILTLPFKNINLNMKEKMICSQFVDSILKLAHMNITKIDSSKVTPNYLYTKATKSSKIYKIYEGKVKHFDFIKASKYLDSLSRKQISVDESSIYKQLESCQETTSFNFNIKENISDDYRTFIESVCNYDNKHDCDKLDALYYANYVLEKMVCSNKYYGERESISEARSKILNEFNTCLDEVLKENPEFDFNESYNNSQYSSITFEPEKDIKDIKSLINCII